MSTQRVLSAAGGKSSDLFGSPGSGSVSGDPSDILRSASGSGYSSDVFSGAGKPKIVSTVGKDSILDRLSWANFDIREKLSSLTFWLIVAVIILIIIWLVPVVLGSVALYYSLNRSASGPAGPTGPPGPTGLTGTPGPTGPPGAGLQLIFDAYNTGSPSNSVKLALGTRYTIPGLMIAPGVCYNTASIPSPSSDCFSITSGSVLGVTAIAGSAAGGYGFYNMTNQDVTFDMDIDFNFSYTYLSPQSAAGPTLNVLIQSYILTWNAAGREYYSSTAFPSAGYTFTPQNPCGQFGGMLNIAYTQRFTLPAATSSSSLGAGCGFDLYPPLLVIVLSTGSPSSNYLTATQPAALSVRAYV